MQHNWSVRRHGTRTAIAGLIGLVMVLGLTGTPASAAVAPAASGHLTNLSHLDFLTATVDPPSQKGHTTYRLDQDPGVGVLWVYANHRSDGGYTRVGGGDYDAATDTYGQGAFDADDISRAAVAYLDAWREFGDEQAREHAYRLLRGLTYLQTDSGPDAGDVVLWMQPDGTLNRTPTPPDDPNPSDAGSSFWLGRTIWALGTGYAAFVHDDPGFAAFLRARLRLALGAVERQDLKNYGTWQVVRRAALALVAHRGRRRHQLGGALRPAAVRPGQR